MSSLEGRYRAVLRWYPTRWRAKNEDVVVGTLLDVADAQSRDKPRLAELVNLGIHGLFTRLRMLPSAVPEAVRDRTSTAALAVGAAIALTAIMQLESEPERGAYFFGREGVTFGVFASPAILVYAAWLVTLLVAIAGFTTAARWAAAATIPLAVGSRVLADANDMLLRPTWTFYGLVIMLAVLVMAGRPAPHRSGVRWLLAWFLPATVVFLLPQILTGRDMVPFQDPLWLDAPNAIFWSPAISWLPFIAIATAIALGAIGQKSWAASVLVLGLPFVVVALSESGALLETSLAVFLIVIAAVAVAVVLRLLFGLHIRVQRVTPRSRLHGQ